MDNLTHSLVGAALAELTVPATAPRATRRTFFIVGVVAANLPDADLVYTRITAPPVGYLLHHRGHTHTAGGIVVLGLAIAAVCALPKIRHSISGARPRLWLLIALALVSHLVLDSWNSYGVHPFWPLTSQWFYGDAVFILDPWLWIILGVAAVMNAQRPVGRWLLAALLAALLLFGAWRRAFPVATIASLLILSTLFIAVTRRWTSPRRSAAALALAAAYVAALFGIREIVRGEVAAMAATPIYPLRVDVVSSPELGNPLCWSVIAIESDTIADVYAMSRGTVSVLARGACGSPRARNVEWETTSVQSLSRLRGLYVGDCWVRAWLQFGRAPEIGKDAIDDLRYSGLGRSGFTTMPLGPRPGGVCPKYLTDWRPPRTDLLDISTR